MVRTILPVATDVFGLVWVEAGSRTRLAAENLFLRKQLALHIERPMRPRRGDDATPITLVMLSRWIDWRRLLTVVQPDTLIRWHRKGFRLFWRMEIEASRTTPCASRPAPAD